MLKSLLTSCSNSSLTGTRQLTVGERQRIRTFYFDLYMSRAKIKDAIGYTIDQTCHVRTSESAAIRP